MTREEMLNECVNRDKAIVQLNHLKSDWDDDWNIAIRKCIEAIKKLPSVSPQPKMGKWLPIEYDGYADGSPVWDKWECSECGCEHNGDEESLSAFCPDCGRKMEVGENG